MTSVVSIVSVAIVNVERFRSHTYAFRVVGAGHSESHPFEVSTVDFSINETANSNAENGQSINVRIDDRHILEIRRFGSGLFRGLHHRTALCEG